MIQRIATIGACLPECRKEKCAAITPRVSTRLETITVHDSGHAGQLDEPLLARLRQKMHMVVADAAADIQIAFDDLNQRGFLPNLIVRHFDQAHGARRLTQRPWQADDVAQDVFTSLVAGRTLNVKKHESKHKRKHESKHKKKRT